MAYSTSAPPSKIVAGTMDGTAGPSVWAYESADVIGDVDATDYFSNGSALGMVVGDLVLVHDTTTPAVKLAWVSAVTAGGAATVTQV